MTGCGWKLRGGSQGGVRGLGTAEAEEIAGVLGSVGTGAREKHGRSREAHGKTRSWERAGESREELGGNTGTRSERKKQTTKINGDLNFCEHFKFSYINSGYYRTEANRTFLPGVLVLAGSCREWQMSCRYC